MVATTTTVFDPGIAFSRNLGYLTDDEQRVLAGKRVAIAGLGGAGGHYLLNMARLGIGHFNLAEIDTFDFVNFNRQVGATCSTVGRHKLDVLREMALDINPGLEIRGFPDGATSSNADDFLRGVDVYLDSIDYFCFPARRAVLAACRRRGIPTITAIPTGMGATMICFNPKGMSFEDFFGMEGHNEVEQCLRFLIGSAPRLLHAGYVADMSRVNFSTHRLPSTPMGAAFCGGMVATEALKILLGRGKVRWAPCGIQMDAYTGHMAKTWTPWGNANPLQRIRLAAARRKLGIPR